MQIHELNTKALTDPAYVAFDDGTDTYKTEFNECVRNAAETAVAGVDLTQNAVAFTSGDDASPAAWDAVPVLTSGSTLSVLFNRISTMLKNIRWLYKMLGTTDISAIGDGTVSGALSTLNSKTLKSIIVSERAIIVTSKVALNAHSGISLTALGGSALVPDVPTGYTFIGNLNVTLNGQVGVTASFDGAQATSKSVVPFIFNGSNNNIGAGASYVLRMYSLCCKA